MPGSLEQAAMQQVMNEENARRDAMTRAWDAYNGKFPNALNRRAGQANDNVKVNRVRSIVDASVSLLFGTPPGWELPKEDDGENTVEQSPEEEALEKCLEANTFEAKLLDYAINGAVCGTPYWHIVPAKPYPRIQVMDPSCMTIRWDPRDLDVVTAYIWQFNSIDPVSHRPRVDRQVVERQTNEAGEVTHWLITDQHADLAGAQNANWTTDTVTSWNYTWPPYLHNKNLPAPNQVYGLPDYSDTVIELNRAINFSYSNRRKIDRLQGHARVWVKGMEGVSYEVGPDEVMKLEGEEAAIGQLAPAIGSDEAASLGKQLDEAIEMETMTPALLLGRDDGSSLPPSGVALKIRMWPATMKLEMKRKLYGPMLIELFRRLLELMGKGPDMRVNLSWPEALPVDPESERKVLLIDQQLGASAETLLTKAGYNYADEKAHKEAEGADLGAATLDTFTNGPGKNMPPAPGQDGSPVDQQPPAQPGQNGAAANG